MKKKSQPDKNEVNEPAIPYTKKEIRFFSSFEEMETENIKWLASLSPEQHLQYAVLLIKRVFAENLQKNPVLGNKILID